MGKYKITVPATSANLGPGFDALGMALNLYNTFEIEIADHFQIDIEGEGAASISREKDNMAYGTFLETLKCLGKDEMPVRIKQANQVPVSRGLGSSANAVVGGILCALAITKTTWSKEEILALATKIEGHPDNVAPAIYGGFTVSIPGEAPRCISIPIDERFVPVVLIPSFELNTKEARAALPEFVSHADAAYNVAHASYVAAAMVKGNYEELRHAMRDKLHQPYRSQLIPGFDAIIKECDELGVPAYLSGAGPTILAVLQPDTAGKFVSAIGKTAGDDWKVLRLAADNEGAKIEEI